MPAMGAFAGGLNVLDPAFSALFPEGLMAFALGEARVYGVARKNLLADGGASGGPVWRL